MTDITPLNNQKVTLSKDVEIGDTTFQTNGKLKRTSDDTGDIGKQFISFVGATEELVYIDQLAEPTLIEDRSAQGKLNIYEYTGLKFDIDSDDITIPPTLATSSFGKAHAIGDEVKIVVSSQYFEDLKSIVAAAVANRFSQSFAFDAVTDVSVGDGRTYFQVPSKFDSNELTIASASVIVAGITGTTDIQISRGRVGANMGDSTTQFDITDEGGNTFRYTYDGTGTDPVIADSDASLRVGDRINIRAQNFNSANNGWFTITAVAADYFEITNASGVAESDKTLGTGSLNPLRWRDMLSTKLTIDSDEVNSETAATPPVIDTDFDDVEEYDLLRVDIDAVQSGTAPKGLIVNLEFLN